MPETLHEDKEKLFAYLTIHDFFDIYLLEDALSLLYNIIKAASTKKIWKKGYPFCVLFYMQQLGKLSDAAFYIYENHAQRDGAIIDKQSRTEDPPLDILQICRGSKLGDTVWSCFPRHLTLNMFYDPYLAIKKFCRYTTEKQWHKTFADIQEYALSGSSIKDVHPPYDILSIQHKTACLIEACHLIEIRSTKTRNRKQATGNK